MLKTKDIKFNGGLLSAGSNAKIIKDNGDEYIVAGLSLAPADTVEGVNVCAMAECADCKNDCLYTTGRGAMSNVHKQENARQNFIEMTKRVLCV